MSYTYTKKVYKDIPFKCVLRKKGYYNMEGFYTAPSQSMFISGYFTSYSGLTLDSEQIGSSPLAIKINSGELPVRYSYCNYTLGCLKAAGQNYNVTTSTYNNFTVVGSPTINDETGIVSGFSVSDYLAAVSDINFNNTWEFQIKINTPADLSDMGIIVGENTNNNGIRLGIYNSHFYILTGNGGWFNTNANVGTYTVLASTTYYLKIGWTGSAYYVDYSLDGTDYTRDVSYNSSSYVAYVNYGMYFGYCPSQNMAMTDGSIDLSETKITINGSTWWTPVGTTTKSAIGLLPSGVTDDGSAQTWNLFYNDGVFLMSTASQLSGYSWCGTINVPAHSI